jgi:hypothetical protein
MIRAATILGGSASKEADKAIDALATAAPYELGATTAWSFALYPVYLRAEAHLAVHQGAAAAVEFQKILDHSGAVANDPIGALGHLGLGRAYAMEAGSAAVSAAVAGASRSRKEEQGRGHEPVLSEAKDAHGTPGETPAGRGGLPALQRARTAYQDFFALWKDADPDIPILQQAKAEYAGLQDRI